MATAKSTTNEGASAKQTKPKKKPGRKSTKVKLPEGLIPIEEETWLLAPLTPAAWPGGTVCRAHPDAPQLYVGAEQGAHVHSGVSAEYPPPDAECR